LAFQALLTDVKISISENVYAVFKSLSGLEKPLLLQLYCRINWNAVSA